MLRKDNFKQLSGFDQYYYDKTIAHDHLLRKINQTVDLSFIREMLTERYSPNRGRFAEEPEFMFKICLLEYLYNLSDVQVIEHIRVNLAYRWFLGLNIDEELPDDSTISYFRVTRVGLDKFKVIFQRLVDQCIEQGLIAAQPKRAIIDATHIIADVAIPTWLSLVRQAFDRVILELMPVAAVKAEYYQQQFNQLWSELRGKTRDEKLPFVLNVSRELVNDASPILNTTTSENPCLAMLEKVISDRNEDARDRVISLVDPEARTGHKSDMRTIQGYKDHIIMDENSEIITAVKVTPANAEDGDQLIDLVNQFKEAHGILPNELSADKGYWSGKNLRFLNEQHVVGNISAMKSSKQNFFSPEDFQFDSETMVVTCPGGKCSKRYREKKNRSGYEFVFTKSQCVDCSLRSKCTLSKTVRYVYISEYFHELQKGREHYKTEAYKKASKNRHRIERRHADKVRNHGLRRSRYRGLDRTWIHSLMSTIASNIKRMTKLLTKPRDKFALSST
ncbi:IS1182 family transposase ISBbr1 [Sporomusa silvacetica DSM 10669]|uniref:IS1182 family transposase ISBbr1 n=1 Tax=Sporomusa silvacetica DSM 10669 TaxID=1123289 RepID=A0ABZ3IKT2_9FIRM|nr:IS1182 family transposase [Sporomusa silvacetica]OZC13393.1 transposase DDE domain protein [Sporomusa silvacetica DSM 10669]